ncbi:uncharacterized protein MEPE_03020 [Melanopsichium pennsylvanicum]|uniref:Uncharacterized protein n=1 Tax=Melanopsichium pennsylvanicum TaxID=63383 RepID=A0AAJ4XM56_9BASI|nr:uncharacterized protein MEPE_03020 [Melanopsichium pennsylvanicum]
MKNCICSEAAGLRRLPRTESVGKDSKRDALVTGQKEQQGEATEFKTTPQATQSSQHAAHHRHFDKPTSMLDTNTDIAEAASARACASGEGECRRHHFSVHRLVNKSYMVWTAFLSARFS